MEIPEVEYQNNVLYGIKEYADKNDASYTKALIYMYLVGERDKVQVWTDGIKLEFDNIHEKLPPQWKYYFGYTKEMPKDNNTNLMNKVESLYVKHRKGERIWLLNKKVRELLEEADGDHTKAVIMALLYNAGIDTDDMQKERAEIICRSIDAKTLWILTGKTRYYKDDFVRKYTSWLLYEDPKV